MITREDVEQAARAESPGAAPEPLSRVQQAIARHMLEAAAVPTFAVEVEVDMTAATERCVAHPSRPSTTSSSRRASSRCVSTHA
jgi:hypothetical protein